MTATVRTVAGDLRINHGQIESDDPAIYELARSYILRRGLPTLYSPDPDWVLAQVLATELDGLAVPGPQIEYTEEDRDRVY